MIMEDYMHTFYRKSSQRITEGDTRRLKVLFAHDQGIENFRISPDGVYLVYNSYIYSSDQLEEILLKNGFNEEKEKKRGFLMKHIRHLAESNKESFGDRTPHCCG
jgi:hypothetical protein